MIVAQCDAAPVSDSTSQTEFRSVSEIGDARYLNRGFQSDHIGRGEPFDGTEKVRIADEYGKIAFNVDGMYACDADVTTGQGVELNICTDKIRSLRATEDMSRGHE